MTDFDWTVDCVVVRSVEAIALYLNEQGDIVLRQQHRLGDDDSFIFFPKSQAKAIAKAILDAAKK